MEFIFHLSITPCLPTAPPTRAGRQHSTYPGFYYSGLSRLGCKIIEIDRVQNKEE